ncbi:hypothetical protein GWI33_014047 [Rhynchophorus ferrugineus]|uniref:Uncharacterized protein n=1 Tax=Rhynchophorus ferrugineus TaxID=354439 RepID=A0A834I812_RHYFE|nr:hypothetical protein GWI33_014047 [Rhynchophorus ferrugineus]
MRMGRQPSNCPKPRQPTKTVDRRQRRRQKKNTPPHPARATATRSPLPHRSMHSAPPKRHLIASGSCPAGWLLKRRKDAVDDDDDNPWTYHYFTRTPPAPPAGAPTSKIPSRRSES